MNKKAFTLVELLLVIVILGIITLITTKGILGALEENRIESAKTTEKLLIHNLKLYNNDTADDYWCTGSKDSGTDCVASGVRNITIAELRNTNQNITLGECLIIPNSMTVRKSIEGVYTYSARIICSREILNAKTPTNNKFSSDGYMYDKGVTPDNVYYETPSK